MRDALRRRAPQTRRAEATDVRHRAVSRDHCFLERRGKKKTCRAARRKPFPLGWKKGSRLSHLPLAIICVVAVSRPSPLRRLVFSASLFCVSFSLSLSAPRSTMFATHSVHLPGLSALVLWPHRLCLGGTSSFSNCSQPLLPSLHAKYMSIIRCSVGVDPSLGPSGKLCASSPCTSHIHLYLLLLACLP